jgi:hypothetical protein
VLIIVSIIIIIYIFNNIIGPMIVRLS